MDERKSTSGGAFFLGDSLVAWMSKKKGSISLSREIFAGDIEEISNGGFFPC